MKLIVIYFLYLIIYIILKRNLKNARILKRLYYTHVIIGIIFFILSLIHTAILFNSSNLALMVTGLVSLVVYVVILISGVLARRNVFKKRKINLMIHVIATLLYILLIVLHIVFAIIK